MKRNQHTFRYNLYINRQEAVGRIEKAKIEIIALEKELTKLDKSGKENTQEFLDIKSQAQDRHRKIDILQESADINKMSISQLQNHLRMFKRELKTLNPNDPKWESAEKEIKAIKNKAKELAGVPEN